MAKAITFGEGVFSINDVDIGLTRGGGQFTVTPEFRQVNADGDRGPVKGRTRKTGSVATMVVRALELLPENLPKLYAATKVTTDGNTITFTGKESVEDSDYVTVTFTGRTADGRAVVMTLENAPNLEALDWSLVEKDEVVAQLTYTAHYEEEHRAGTREPWSVVYTDVA